MVLIATRKLLRWVTVLGLLNNSCTHTSEKGFTASIESGDCEGAATKIGKEGSSSQNLLDATKQGGGKAASYSLATAGYTADVVITSALGIVVIAAAGTVFYFLPVAPLLNSGGNVTKVDPEPTTSKLPEQNEIGIESPTGSNPGSSSSIGNGDDYPSFGLTAIGPLALSRTEYWRENSASVAIFKELRAVAKCYESRDSLDGLTKALLQLEQIKDPILAAGLGAGRMREIHSDVARVYARLKIIYPEYENELKAERRRLAKATLGKQLPATWRDEQTGSVWRYQPAKVPNGDLAETVCETISTPRIQVWQIPNLADIRKAIAHGVLSRNLNPEFEEARTKHERAFIRNGSGFGVFDLNTGEITPGDGAKDLSLICLQM